MQKGASSDGRNTAWVALCQSCDVTTKKYHHNPDDDVIDDAHKKIWCCVSSSLSLLDQSWRSVLWSHYQGRVGHTPCMISLALRRSVSDENSPCWISVRHKTLYNDDVKVCAAITTDWIRHCLTAASDSGWGKWLLQYNYMLSLGKYYNTTQYSCTVPLK